jgi:hypothetical protein
MERLMSAFCRDRLPATTANGRPPDHSRTIAERAGTRAHRISHRDRSSRQRPEWRRRINAAILKRQGEITAILRDYGVPLLMSKANLSPPEGGCECG